MRRNMIPLKRLWASESKNKTNIGKHKYHWVGIEKAHIPAWHTFYRAIGLKILLVRNRLGYGQNEQRKEEEKVLVSTSRKTAFVRLAVHVPPAVMTIFVILWNRIEYLNGPQLAASATFALQLLAKFHELLITGSLTVLVLDIVRYELLQNGLNLGLLTSSFEFTGLNFLYSPNFFSVFFADYRWRKRLFLLLSITICCVMTSVVGPASALLFIPTQVWKPYGWTQFYLGGDDQDRWPSQLTTDHGGPQSCRDDHGRMLMMVCPAGGYNTIFPRVVKPPEVVFDIPIHDARYTRLIHGKTPWLNMNASKQVTSETWAVTSQADVTFMMQDLSYKYGDAQTVATGRARQLRDFVDGIYVISESKFPVGRTVCGPPRVMNHNVSSLPFPILAPNHKWRNLSTVAYGDSWGPTLEYDIGDTESVYVGQDKQTQASTKWAYLGPEYGAATAGLAVMSHGLDFVVGRGCTLDFRWATGRVYRLSGSLMGAFETEIGPKHSPSNAQNQYTRYEAADFFDPVIAPYMGSTIKADKDWLDGIFPKYFLSSNLNGYNMTALESMIDATTASFPDFVIENTTSRSYQALSQLELIVTVAFVDVLARTSWYKSLEYPDDSMMIDPVLQRPATSDQQRILNGGAIYSPPENISYGSGTANWYTYGVAWTMRESDQFLSVAVLGFHLLLASIHIVWTMWERRSMHAWDSIVELLVLAWNSEPMRRDADLKNCSVGIHGLGPMDQMVKAVVVEEEEGTSEGRVELIIVDHNTLNKDGRRVQSIEFDKKYR